MEERQGARREREREELGLEENEMEVRDRNEQSRGERIGRRKVRVEDR